MANPGGLNGIDAHAILGYNSTGIGIDAKLFGHKLQNCCEGSLFGNLQPARDVTSVMSAVGAGLVHVYTYTLNGSFGSEVSVILKLTFAAVAGTVAAAGFSALNITTVVRE